MQDSPGVVRNVILFSFVSFGLLTLLYWYHRSKVRKLKSDLSDRDAIIRDLRRKVYDLQKRYMTGGSMSRKMRGEMEDLNAKLDMLTDPMEEFRTRVEDIKRDIEKYTKQGAE